MWAVRQALQVELTQLSSNSLQVIAEQSSCRCGPEAN